MHRVDSFIKESQRLNPVAICKRTVEPSVLLNRILMKDHIFSDGTAILKGTSIGVATDTTHLNADRYEDPHRFDGFRFVKLKARNLSHSPSSSFSQTNKFDITNTNSDSLGFGLGRHVCPGRFFAASELKIMLAHVVVMYDMKLAEGKRPDNVWLSVTCVPNPTAQVLFRRCGVA
ncbi:unnamed protein product [Cyclocybe aegerita]|uniref:Cytochrome P450 n=1 Tax=Cyclocybe aegerita TaxID=1973307 RepID=A0A8S0WS45_CYCAE|nr:unnamed protein product [Cyclocybe aegerita]